MGYVLDTIKEHYALPFEPRPDQVEDIERLCHWNRMGVYLPVGAGKTFTSTMVAFYAAIIDKIDQIIVIAPPILLPQWNRWLSSFKGVTTCVYRGLPAQRAGMDLLVDCTLMTSGILKNDHAKLMEVFGPRRVFIIVDEATVIRDISTQAHKALRDLVETDGHKMLALLTGTTLSAPHQAYGYIRLITPGVYRDYTQFQVIHVTKVDQYKTPCRFQNLEMLSRNMMLQAVRREADDILDLPEITYVPMVYDLDPKHLELYNRVVEDELITLDDGTILDGLTPGRMRMVCQRVIMMPSEFSGNKLIPSGYQLIDAMADEMGSEKFIIYGNFHSSVEAIFDYCVAKKMNPVLVYGGSRSTSTKNLAAVEQFKADPKVRVMVAHPQSGGVGVDGLQHVCRAELFMELPTPALFQQCVGRVKREGQKSNCVIKLAIANKTIQVDLARNAMKKEDWVQQVVPTKETLRKALLGG